MQIRHTAFGVVSASILIWEWCKLFIILHRSVGALEMKTADLCKLVFLARWRKSGGVLDKVCENYVCLSVGQTLSSSILHRLQPDLDKHDLCSCR